MVQPLVRKPPSWSETELQSLDKSVSDLLKIGAVSKCEPSDDQFISNIFLVPKSDGSMRFILNLKQFNSFVDTEHFKLEDKNTAMRLMRPDCFMAKIDLKDAYFLLPVDKSHRKYLCFVFRGQTYQFNCLCFGLNVAPFCFY